MCLKVLDAKKILFLSIAGLLTLSLFIVSVVPTVKFTHGVASGDVRSDSAVLWTRVDNAALLTLHVSADPSFKQVDFKGKADALKSDDYTVKGFATGLKPSTLYYYRWSYGSTTSETGTFRTAPAADAPANVHFAFTGDSDPTRVNGIRVFGDWESLNSARLEGLDFFIYLGDTIYADFRAGRFIPDSALPPAQTLDEFRQLYKDSREVTALHDLMKDTSTYAVWDDHEIRNDWDGQTVDPALYQISRQSFHEYMPLVKNTSGDPNCAGPTQFRVFHWGKDIDVIILDTRSCRSTNVSVICNGDPAPTLPRSIREQNPSFFTKPVSNECVSAINDPSRTILGISQKAMFKDALLSSTAKYKFVVTPEPIQQMYVNPYDRWEGYAAERTEILQFMRDNKITNVVFLSTDQHNNVLNEVFIDHFVDPTPIAYEAITGPISTLTQQKAILALFGESAGQKTLDALQGMLDLVGVDCRNLDAFSYGTVEFDATTGKTIITLKDDGGNTIHDQRNPTIFCTKIME
jgi:phosphodiesterase/alkaline phosphatase D-like protein